MACLPARCDAVPGLFDMAKHTGIEPVISCVTGRRLNHSTNAPKLRDAFAPKMAGRAGFEPARDLLGPWPLSRGLVSTAHPPARGRVSCRRGGLRSLGGVRPLAQCQTRLVQARSDRRYGENDLPGGGDR